LSRFLHTIPIRPFHSNEKPHYFFSSLALLASRSFQQTLWGFAGSENKWQEYAFYYCRTVWHASNLSRFAHMMKYISGWGPPEAKQEKKEK
jgi:hypothetical protein